MTGEAEEKREVKPTPLKPTLVNGSFEEVVGGKQVGNDKSEPAGWHYQRQLTLKTDASAPSGNRFAVFKNDEPGRPSQALQGFAIDGRRIDRLELTFSARGNTLSRGQRPDDWPTVAVTFYDDRRAMIDHVEVAQFTGSFDWKAETYKISVPLTAREAIIRITLEGGVGELAIDDLQLRVAK